jgi:hypothetical protein
MNRIKRPEKSSYELGSMADPDEQSPENFYVLRSQWLEYLVIRRDLTHGDYRVASFIASKIRPETDCMWWGVKKIADTLGVSIGTVTSATDTLIDRGLMYITKGPKGSYHYYMRMPIDPDGAALSAMKVKRKKTGGRKPRVSKNETGWVSKNET